MADYDLIVVGAGHLDRQAGFPGDQAEGVESRIAGFAAGEGERGLLANQRKTLGCAFLKAECAAMVLRIDDIVAAATPGVEQPDALARLAIEARVVGQLFEHDDEARLRAGLVHEVGHAVVQGVQIFAKVRREGEGLSNGFEHFLLALRCAHIGVQEVLARRLSGLHQVFHAVGADGLNNIRSDGLQLHGRLPPWVLNSQQKTQASAH